MPNVDYKELVSVQSFRVNTNIEFFPIRTTYLISSRFLQVLAFFSGSFSLRAKVRTLEFQTAR